MSDVIKGSRRSADTRQNRDMRGGQRRQDKVGGSGIYPGWAQAPGDAVIREEAEFGHATSSHPPPQEQGDEGNESSGRSER